MLGEGGNESMMKIAIVFNTINHDEAKKLTTMLIIILVQQNLGNVFATICTYPWRNGETLTSVNTLFNTTMDSFQMFTNPTINGTHNT
jgi:hypothetical protein